MAEFGRNIGMNKRENWLAIAFLISWGRDCRRILRERDMGKMIEIVLGCGTLGGCPGKEALRKIEY